MFLKSPTAMHVTEYKSVGDEWKKIIIDSNQLNKLLLFIFDSFEFNANNDFIKITSYSYGNNDTFYEAKGNYSCLRTCKAMKKTDVKTAIWTPFDWGILKHL